MQGRECFGFCEACRKQMICIVEKEGAILFLSQHFTPGLASLFSKPSLSFPMHKSRYCLHTNLVRSNSELQILILVEYSHDSWASTYCFK